MEDFLTAVGVDIKSLGLEDTPIKVAKLYIEQFSGLKENTEEIWGDLYETKSNGPVIIKNIPFYSICEHHLLPFFGTINIVYIPKNGMIAGFSKFSQIINIYARRPQLQERLNHDIAEEIYRGLKSEGVLVSIKATQLCMRMTNKNNEGTYTYTVVAKGIFTKDDNMYKNIWNMLGE